MQTPVVLEPPVRGEWAILNPPGHPRLAFDFLAVDQRRNPYRNASLARHLTSKISVEQTLAWEMPVFAVLPGSVVAASDGVPDRRALSMIRDLVALMLFGPKAQPPFANLGGNYVILDCGGVFPLFAHLRCGSIRVRTGQEVQSGTLLGAVGNSGASLQPHLHFQVMSSADPFPLFANLLPVQLSHVQVKRGHDWCMQTNYAPRNGDHFRIDGGAA